MGVQRVASIAALAIAIAAPGARAWAETVTEPIARLALEGGYDSNALHLGQGGDRIARVSPELGLQLRNPRWEASAVYGADYLVYQRMASGGIWNHRGALELEGELSRRLDAEIGVRGGYAYDPVGLALMGIFRTGEEQAWTLSARGRLEYRVTRRVDAALTLRERAVVFSDGTGGAMHAPGAEVLYRLDRRLSVGAAYAVGLFQGFEPDRTDLAFSNGVLARARYRVTRHVRFDAAAGPVVWVGPDGAALVPELSAELQWARRGTAVRAGAAHALGIGSTARPGLVDSLEVGAVHRLSRRFDVRGDLGMWRSGRAPSGADAVLGYAAGGEAGMTLSGGVRLAVAASHFARLDGGDGVDRSTVALRLGWRLDGR